MFHPAIIVIVGDDIKEVTEELKTFKTYYNFRTVEPIPKISKVIIKNFNWSANGTAELKDLREGLKLPFFSDKHPKLSWTPIEYIPKDWITDRNKGWTPNVDNDVALWNSKDPEIALTDHEKLMVTTILDSYAEWDFEIKRLYIKSLIPTFKHCDIEDMLIDMCLRKDQHTEMWDFFREKLVLEHTYILPRNLKRWHATSFEEIINNISETIEAESIDKLAESECLAYFTKKGHFLEFIKLVERRNKESKEHAQVLKKLLGHIEDMYPYLNEAIGLVNIRAKYYAKMHNDNVYKLPNLEMFDKTHSA